MQLVFTKGSDKHDRLDIHHDGGTVETLQCPKQRIIPHDMVHYAVEHTLARRGFLGRVRDGERAMFTMLPEAASDAVERLVEVFQGDAWSGGQSPAGEMIDLYRVTCDARGCPMLTVTVDDIEAVRARITELDAEWQVLPVGGTLRLDF
ncbi:MAG: hypothetical protein SF172_00415 [Burkholderiales bacterium]|nr:hypothetical protein [Burkholderiales bacterium]